MESAKKDTGLESRLKSKKWQERQQAYSEMVTAACSGTLDTSIAENLDKLLTENNPAAMTSLLQAIDAVIS